MKVQNKVTGEIKYAVYAANTSGNMRYNVDGKFLTDKQFDKNYIIVKANQDIKPVWCSHLRMLFDEILINEGTHVLHKPLQITINIIAEAAMYAASIKDEKMIGYFARLAIYTFSDPESKDFDKTLTNYYIDKTK